MLAWGRVADKGMVEASFPPRAHDHFQPYAEPLDRSVARPVRATPAMTRTDSRATASSQPLNRRRCRWSPTQRRMLFLASLQMTRMSRREADPVAGGRIDALDNAAGRTGALDLRGSRRLRTENTVRGGVVSSAWAVRGDCEGSAVTHGIDGTAACGYGHNTTYFVQISH